MEDNEQVSNAEELARLALDEDCEPEIFMNLLRLRHQVMITNFQGHNAPKNSADWQGCGQEDRGVGSPLSDIQNEKFTPFPKAKLMKFASLTKQKNDIQNEKIVNLVK